jgi:hypothetical protein
MGEENWYLLIGPADRVNGIKRNSNTTNQEYLFFISFKEMNHRFSFVSVIGTFGIDCFPPKGIAFVEKIIINKDFFDIIELFKCMLNF